MFALGMRSKIVKLYRHATCQLIKSLEHGDLVKLLKFDSTGRRIASAGYRVLNMWSVEGTLLWSTPLQLPPATMSFGDGDRTFIIVDRKGNVLAFNAETGTPLPPHSENGSSESTPNLAQGSWRGIIHADICPNGELIAVAFRDLPPQVWSITHDFMIGTCVMAEDKPGLPIMSPSDLLFNPNPDIELLAVCYQDGRLSIFHKWLGDQQHEIISTAADALILAATSNGHTLATGDATGTIKLWEFETLTLLQSIRSSECEVRYLAFSGDGFRLYDIRDTKTKIWEPSALVRKGVSEGSGISTSFPGLAAKNDQRRKDVVDITQIIAPVGTGCILVGKADGSVLSYDANTGGYLSQLWSHRRNVFVRNFSSNHNTIASSDTSNKIEAYEWKLIDGAISIVRRTFETKIGAGSVLDILLHPLEPWLLVFRTNSTVLINIETQAERRPQFRDMSNYRAWLWLPVEPEQVFLLGARNHVIDIYSFDQLMSDQKGSEWHVTNKNGEGCQPIEKLAGDKGGKYIAITLRTNSKTGDPSDPKLLVYETANLLPRTTIPAQTNDSLTREPILSIPVCTIKTFFGFYGDRVVFLTHELWIQSFDLAKPASSRTTNEQFSPLPGRHFFVPLDFIGSNNGVDGITTEQGTVVFPKEGELGVVRNALEWSLPRESEIEE